MNEGRLSLDGVTSTYLLEGDQPVLVDFSASWCRPCQQIRPVVEQLAARFAGRLKVVEVDVERDTYLARLCEVEKLPCLVLYRGGRPIKLRTGYSPSLMPDLADRIENLLGNMPVNFPLR